MTWVSSGSLEGVSLYGRFKEIVRRTGWMLRLARSAMSVHSAVSSLGRSRAINKYLKSHEVKKLQIGAGPNLLGGWLNTDKFPRSPRCVHLDASKPFPFPDSIFHCVFSEHQIEQLSYQQGLFMLRECFRVLNPGGKVRIATPSLDTLADLIASEKSDVQQQYIRWITDVFLPEIKVYHASVVVNNAMRSWGHVFIYDRATLKNSLEEAGFTNVMVYSPGESDSAELRGVEAHGKTVGNEGMNRFETMVLEGTRP